MSFKWTNKQLKRLVLDKKKWKPDYDVHQYAYSDLSGQVISKSQLIHLIHIHKNIEAAFENLIIAHNLSWIFENMKKTQRVGAVTYCLIVITSRIFRPLVRGEQIGTRDWEIIKYSKRLK